MGIATSAPQEAVAAASALCAAVIPYVFARGLLTEADAKEIERRRDIRDSDGGVMTLTAAVAKEIERRAREERKARGERE